MSDFLWDEPCLKITEILATPRKQIVGEDIIFIIQFIKMLKCFHIMELKKILEFIGMR